jgi:hypothetical protein
MALLACSHLLVSPLASVTRYTLVLFPCFMLLAVWLEKRPILAAGSVIVGGMVQALLLEYWVHFGFVA